MDDSGSKGKWRLFTLIGILVACLGLAFFLGPEKTPRTPRKPVVRESFAREAKLIVGRIERTKSLSDTDRALALRHLRSERGADAPIAALVFSSAYEKKVLTYEEFSSVIVERLKDCPANQTVIFCFILMNSLKLSTPEYDASFGNAPGGELSKDDKARLSRLAESSNADSRRVVGLELIEYPAYSKADFSWASEVVNKLKGKANGSDLLYWGSFSKAFDGRFRKFL